MKFTEQFQVTRTPQDDWLDPLLTADTRLYVDPFLIYQDGVPPWVTSHDHLLRFFAIVLSLVKEAKDNRRSSAWLKASSLLMFPEPFEFCLGHAEGSPLGSGSGRGLQRDMLEGAATAVRLGIDRVDHMELLVLFQEGIGVDRISDIVCNVLKSHFIAYTQEVCRRHHVPMEKRRVRHASWDDQFLRWNDDVVDVPINPAINRPVLLTPERFLRPIPTVDPSDFWDYAWESDAEQLRADFNYDLSRNVPAKMKARLAREHPNLAIKYLHNLESKTAQPYDLDKDADGRVRWYESGADLAEHNPLSFVPREPAEFETFIGAITESFSHGLEESDAWRLLWVDGRPRSESYVQALFRSTVLHYCRANQVVLSSESNAGRGPVDFKFVKDWHAQALIELKLTNNSRYWEGLQEQTVQYLKSEEVKLGFFVSVGFHDNDFQPERMDRVRRVAKRVSEDTGKDVRVRFIDARPKKSASKLKGSRQAD